MNEKYTIAFADGTSFTGVTMNGSNYVISGDHVSEVAAADTTSIVITAEDGTSVTMSNASIDRNVLESSGDTYIVIRELTEAEQRDLDIEARLSYLEMVGGIE